MFNIFAPILMQTQKRLFALEILKLPVLCKKFTTVTDL